MDGKVGIVLVLVPFEEGDHGIVLVREEHLVRKGRRLVLTDVLAERLYFSEEAGDQ